MTWQQFTTSSWKYLACIGEGYNNKVIESWRQTREIVAMVYNAHAKRKKRSSEIIKLPCDVPAKKSAPVKLTSEDVRKMVNLFNSIKNDRSIQRKD